VIVSGCAPVEQVVEPNFHNLDIAVVGGERVAAKDRGRGRYEEGPVAQPEIISLFGYRFKFRSPSSCGSPSRDRTTSLDVRLRDYEPQQPGDDPRNARVAGNPTPNLAFVGVGASSKTAWGKIQRAPALQQTALLSQYPLRLEWVSH
jgi:hypothetical protein